MTLPLNDLKRTYNLHASELEAKAIEVMRSGWWINGQHNKIFCDEFSSYLGVRHCIGVGNGTDALEIALRALLGNDAKLELPQPFRDGATAEVVTVANAGGYATTAIHLTGCVPVFADIEADSQLISLESAVACVGTQTVAVIATHLYGGLVQISRLRSMLDSAGYPHVSILEDCAQAHGLDSGAGMAGSLGNIATFSFYPTKNLGALGDGGAITTNSDVLAEKVQRLHQYGWIEKYTIDRSYGRNSRLDEYQAAMLSVLLPQLDQGNQRRVAILDRYEAALPAGLKLVRSQYGSVGHLAILMSQSRDRLLQHFVSLNISTAIHYPILDCDQEGWKVMAHRLGPTGLDISRRSVSKILTVPCFSTMTQGEIDQVCNALASFST